MRDWNEDRGPYRFAWSWFWSYLWGIEIVTPLDICFLRSSFWSYLWGIEICFLRWFLPFLFLFWSYLWGIEITKQSRRCGTHESFDLTYEGLKYGYQQALGKETRGFDLTYEGLKYRHFNYFWAGCPVLILPMRDWNLTTRLVFSCPLGVLILPMRDWNRYTFLIFLV